MSDEIPVACCLSDEELRNREATLLAQFKAAVIESEELDHGYLFRVLGDKKSIALVTELIMAERECCPFLTFELSPEPGMGPVSVGRNDKLFGGSDGRNDKLFGDPKSETPAIKLSHKTQACAP
jgi:hypothetical protein